MFFAFDSQSISKWFSSRAVLNIFATVAGRQVDRAVDMLRRRVLRRIRRRRRCLSLPPDSCRVPSSLTPQREARNRKPGTLELEAYLRRLRRALPDQPD